MAAYSASGICIPPHFIFIGKKKVGENILSGAPPSSAVSISEAGWMTEELFYGWIQFFARSIPSKRPAILIVDNHESRFSLRIIEFCILDNIRLVLLPPNATHLMQVGDVAVHAPFKSAVRAESHRYICDTGSTDINKYSYCKIIGPAFISIFSASNIISGYSTTGIYPLNRAKTLIHLQSIQENIAKKVSIQTQLNFPEINKILTTPTELRVRSQSELGETLRKRRALMPCTSLLSHSEMKQYFQERANDPNFNNNNKKKAKRIASVPKMKSLNSLSPDKKRKHNNNEDNSDNNVNKENIAPNSTVTLEPRITRAKQLKIKNQGRPKRQARGLSERTISLGDYEEIRELE